MILQLNPPIPMYVVDKGCGYAIALIDYSSEFDLYWVIAMDSTGEIWTLNNKFVRLQKNISLGRYINNNEGELYASSQR